jgi:PAS domain S-box-containing protein
MPDQSAIEQVLEKRFFQQAPLLVALANLEGRFLQLGGEWTSTLGWSTEELLSRPFLDLVHPDDLPATLAEIELLARGHKTIQFQNRYRTKDGRWCLLRWYSHVPGDGTVFAIAMDVTESTRRDVELARRTAILELVTTLQHAYVRRGELRSDVLQDSLQQLLSLSGSQFGFFAELVK